MYTWKYRVPAEEVALKDLAFADDPLEHFDPDELDLPEYYKVVDIRDEKCDTYIYVEIDGMPDFEGENKCVTEFENLNRWLYNEYYI